MARNLALAALTVVAACSVYEPSLLTGQSGSAGMAGSAVTAGRGGSDGGAGVGGAASAGAPSGTGGQAGTSTFDGGAPGDGGDTAAAGEGGHADPGAGGTSGTSGASGASGAGGTSGASGAGTSGQSGDAGRGGATTGGAGSGGNGAGGAGAGSAGMGGAGGVPNGETCTGATGCARLSVPLTALDERTHFSIELGAATDFTNAIVSYRVFKAAGTGGRIWAYVQHGGTPDYNLIYGGARSFDTLNDWATVTWDVGATTVGFEFDKSVIYRIGFEIVANGTGPWTNPTVVYIDSLSVTTGPAVGPWNFDDPSSISSAVSPPLNVLWMSDNVPDELLPGSTLSWIGP